MLNEKMCSNSEDLARCFFIGMLTITSVYFIANAVCEGAFLNACFQGTSWNSFTDYFNLIEYVRQGDPYSLSSNYTAINFVIVKCLFQLIPRQDLVGMSSPAEEVLALRNTTSALISFILFTLVTILIIAFCIRKLLSRFSEITKNLGVAAILLSSPSLFLIERGNLLLLTLAALLFFFCFRKSDQKWQRILAGLALALASAMKLYPAVFALLYLKEKKIREFIFVTITGFALLIIPFFIFNGVSSIEDFVIGMSASVNAELGMGNNYSFSNLIRILYALICGKIGQIGIIGSIIPFVLTITTYLLAKNEWEKLLSLGIMCVWVPSFSYAYTLLLLLPGMLSLLVAKEETDKYRLLCLILIFVIMVPIPLGLVEPIAKLMPEVNFPLSWSVVIGNIALLLLETSILIKNIFKLREKLNNEQIMQA